MENCLDFRKPIIARLKEMKLLQAYKMPISAATESNICTW